jgi:uracil-DNA glycosylase
VTLGRVAFDALWAARAATGHTLPSPRPRFAHGAAWQVDALTVLASYHPSQRNTQTGLLTTAMFDAVFAAARHALDTP